MRFKKGIAVLICLCLTVGTLTGCGGNKAETVSPEIGTIEQTVEDTGIVVFEDSYSVTTTASGKILSVHFEEGDAVKKGQILYTIDSKDLKNQISSTKIGLEKANEAYNQSVKAVNDLTVKSYANGLVTKVYCKVGDFVSAGMKIADVVDSETLTLEVPFNLVDENIYNGQSAQVIMNADGSVINGTVTKVYEAAQVLDGRQYGVNVEITIANPGALKQGDLAFAKIGDMSSVSEGSLKNKTEQGISATQSGQVQAIHISEGNKVYSGTTVMTIKNDALKNAVNSASLNIKDIKNTLSQLNSKLDDYNVVSPVDGVVTQKIAKETDIAAPGTPLAMIGDNGRLYIDMNVDEQYIKDIEIGQKAEAVIQGEEDTVYTGSVDKISDSGIAMNGVTYYTVKIYLDSQDNLMEAMNMDVKIITSEKENVMKIPVSAVRGNKVTVLEGNKKVEKEIETGIKNKDYIEVLSGLSEKDKIVTGGNEE